MKSLVAFVLVLILVLMVSGLLTPAADARTDRADKPVVFFVGPTGDAVNCQSILGKLESAVADTPVPLKGGLGRFDAKQFVRLGPTPAAKNCEAELAANKGSIEGLAERFAQWLAKRFSKPVDVVAEGTAGVAVRYALGMNGRKGWPKLDVEDVVTLGSPHNKLTESAFRHPDGIQGTDWSVIGSEGDEMTTAEDAIKMDADHKTIYKNKSLTHQKLLDDAGPERDAHIIYQHGDGKEITWQNAPHVAERVAYDLVYGVDSCGLDEEAAAAPGSCSSACSQRIAGWMIKFACAERDKLNAGATDIQVISPDGTGTAAIPNVLIKYALPLATPRRLLVPLILPDIEINAGGFRLTAYETTLDDDGLTVGTATVSIPHLGEAVIYGLRVTNAGTIKADALEVEALGGSLEAEDITFSRAAGLSVKRATLGLPRKLGGSAVTFEELGITAAGKLRGTLRGGRVTIGDMTAEIEGARVTESGFTLAAAKLTLPRYLGGTGSVVRGKNLSWDGRRFALDEAEGDLDFALAGGKLKVEAHVLLKLLPNGGYEMAGSGRVVVPGTPPFFEAEAAVEVKSVDCDPAPGDCRNAIYLQKAHLSVKIGKAIPLGSTGLALRGLGGKLKPTQVKPNRTADGKVHGVTYTFTLNAGIQTFPNPIVFDGDIKGSLSTNGNFGFSVDGKMLRFIDVHGGMCVLLTGHDTVCAKHISSERKSQITGPGAFVDVSATAAASYSGVGLNVNAQLKAKAFGRVVVAGGEVYADAELAGSFTTRGSGFLLPDVAGDGTIKAQVGRFRVGDRSVLGVKGTIDVRLSAQSASGGSSLDVQRSIFIDQNGNYTTQNVAAETLTPGTSLRQMSPLAWAPPTRVFGRPAAISTAGILHPFTLAPRLTQTMIILRAESGSPSLELTAPGGARAVIDEAGAIRVLAHGNRKELNNVYSVATRVPHTVVAYLPKAQPGRWLARAGGVTPNAYRLDVSGAQPTPRLVIARPSLRRPRIVTRRHRNATIAGTLRGIAGNTTISLYAGRDGCAARGAAQLLSANVPVRNGRWAYHWKSIKTPPGRYLLRAQLNNATGPLVSTCSPNAVVVKAPKRSKSSRARRSTSVAAASATPIATATPSARRLPGFGPLRARAAAAATNGKRSCPEKREGEYKIPTFEVSETATEWIAKHNYNAIKNEKKKFLLHYGPYSRKTGCEKVARENRKKACGHRPYRVGGKPGPKGERTSCDEYPFASTYEGGEGAAIEAVKPSENARQGGQISAFLRKNALDLSQLDGAFYVCVTLKSGAKAGHCRKE